MYEKVKSCHGCIIPWWFGDTAAENMIETLRYIREEKIPCLGICLGLQLMVLEYLRNVVWYSEVNSIELDQNCAPNDAITLLDSQKNVIQMWGTMRLGKQESKLKPWIILSLYSMSERSNTQNVISERFRHRYEVHPDFADKLNKTDLKISWTSRKQWIVQFIEMNEKTHPYYVATQSHPELTSKLEDPAPLFIGLIKECLK